MALALITGAVGPPLGTPFTFGRREWLDNAHRLMRRPPYRRDVPNTWAPDFARDCQGKAAAAMVWLAYSGMPIEAMRGYIGDAVDEAGKFGLHAIAVVRLVAHGEPTDYALDNLQASVRTMSWAERAGIYRGMRPDMRMEWRP